MWCTEWHFLCRLSLFEVKLTSLSAKGIIQSDTADLARMETDGFLPSQCDRPRDGPYPITEPRAAKVGRLDVAIRLSEGVLKQRPNDRRFALFWGSDFGGTCRPE